MKRGTPDHPKVYQLAKLLRIPWTYAVGVLEVLWHVTARYAPQGNIGKWEDKIIAAHLGWGRNPERLIGALIESGWIDRDPDYRLLVHDWDQHADQSVRKTLKYNGLDFIRPASQQILYFIRARHSRKIKIGVTGRHDDSRLKELQRNCMEPLEVLLRVPGGFALEEELHRRFTSSRTQGEWFEESPALLSVINEMRESFPEAVGNSVGDIPPHHARMPVPEPKPKPEPEPESARARSDAEAAWNEFLETYPSHTGVDAGCRWYQIEFERRPDPHAWHSEVMAGLRRHLESAKWRDPETGELDLRFVVSIPRFLGMPDSRDPTRGPMYVDRPPPWKPRRKPGARSAMEGVV